MIIDRLWGCSEGYSEGSIRFILITLKNFLEKIQLKI